MRTRAAAYIGANWVGLYGSIVAAGLVDKDSHRTLIVSSFIVGIQVGQTVTIQTSPSGFSPSGPIRSAVAFLSAASLVAAQFAGDSSTLILATSGGLIAGTVSGGAAAAKLATGDRLGCQILIARRSVGLLSLVLTGEVLSLADLSAVSAAMFAVLAPWAVVLSGGSTAQMSTGISRTAGLTLLLGAAASLLYRSDSNIVRTSVVESPNFATWNTVLVGYSAVQAGVGVLTLYLVLARRSIWRDRVRRHSRIFDTFLGASLIASALIALIALVGRPEIVLVAAIAGVTWTSSLASISHCLGLSGRIYMAGATSAFALICALTLGVGTIETAGMYVATLLALVTSALAARPRALK